MGLVDYSSEEEKDEVADVKPATVLPPLPRAFHDLYAATVRTAPADDPSLHQGRHRATPHVAGQWPSHLYIEWFPSAAEHAQLSTLLASLRSTLGGGHDAHDTERTTTEEPPPLLFHSFLTSDLGAPLPLHISLSRPFVLATAEKAGFLAQLVDAVATSGVGRFDVTFAGLDWYRGPDSARAFLVLRAVVAAASDDANAATAANLPLVTLLDRCNEQVTAVGQPALYAERRRRSSKGNIPDTDADAASSSSSSSPSSFSASAFHVSVAWALAPEVDAWTFSTQQVYEQWRHDTRGGLPLRIPVDSIKAKIGNAVTDIPLRKRPLISVATTGTTGASYGRQRQPKRARGGVGGDKTESGDDDRPSRKKSLFGL